MTFYAVAIADPDDGNSVIYRIQAQTARIAAWVGFCHFINKETSNGPVDVYNPAVEGGWFDVQRWFLNEVPGEAVSIETAFDWQDLIGSVEQLSTLPDVKFKSEKLIFPKSNDSER